MLKPNHALKELEMRYAISSSVKAQANLQVCAKFDTIYVHSWQKTAQFVAVILWVTCISLLRADVNLLKK